mmetsp:Transcript_39223/g.113228  ORF Transcript_39223/g.113228 Transcript_39223/m.113228 type:complete len:367 (+) Transcript_39223:115-1215(+)
MVNFSAEEIQSQTHQALWTVCVEVLPISMSWKFESTSLEASMPRINELVCHVANSGTVIHSLHIQAVKSASSQAWMADPESPQRTLSVMPGPDGCDRPKRDTFGDHQILVPATCPRVIRDSYLISTPLGRFSGMFWVVLSAACALAAGTFKTFVSVSKLEGNSGSVRIGHPFAILTFVGFALNCLVLVLHRVNRDLGWLAFRTFDPILVFALVLRQWACLTYNNMKILGSSSSWPDDAGRLAIDLIFCACITVCDAWDVRTRIKCLFLWCCLLWSGVNLYIGTVLMRPDGWSSETQQAPLWARALIGETGFVSSWLAISLYIFKAIMAFGTGGDFAFCSGKLELRRGGKSRYKVEGGYPEKAIELS